MKKLILIFAVLFTTGLIAQEITYKPTLEKEGKLTKATYYHDNGEIAQIGYYLNGKVHGEWIAFNRDGKKIAMAEYEKGKKTGKWFFWNGDTLSEVNYENNKVATVTHWNNANPVVITE